MNLDYLNNDTYLSNKLIEKVKLVFDEQKPCLMWNHPVFSEKIYQKVENIDAAKDSLHLKYDYLELNEEAFIKNLLILIQTELIVAPSKTFENIVKNSVKILLKRFGFKCNSNDMNIISDEFYECFIFGSLNNLNDRLLTNVEEVFYDETQYNREIPENEDIINLFSDASIEIYKNFLEVEYLLKTVN